MKKLSLILIPLLIIFVIGNQSYALAKETISAPINFQIELLDWEDVNKLLPRKATFTVIDVESGKSFNVQRRAGTHHADVQPLTKKDTKIMKKIYGGKWSWRRRAILILTANKLIAASMHGMPHGAGALQNGFPGHFCIHFVGSITHRSERSDLAHQIMILKAAGKIDEYLLNISPTELMNASMVFIKNGDQGLVKKIAISDAKNISKEIKKLENIEAIQWNVLSTIDNENSSLVTTIPVELNIFAKDTGSSKTKLTFTLVRTSPLSPWKVNLDPLMSRLDES